MIQIGMRFPFFKIKHQALSKEDLFVVRAMITQVWKGPTHRHMTNMALEKGAVRKRRMNRAVAYLIVGAIVVIIIIGTAALTYRVFFANSKVEVKIEGNYPWLVQGTHANYNVLYNFFGAPWFVTNSGQWLYGAFEAPGTRGNGEPPKLVNGIVPGDGYVSLNWTVESRSRNEVTLGISFDAFGCQDNEAAYHIGNQSAAPCTYYNVSKDDPVLVDLTSNEAYLNGVDEGVANFLEPPLLDNGTIDGGSIFIGQQRFESESNVSAPFASSMLGLANTVKVSGSLVNDITNPFKVYETTPTSFGYFNSNYPVGWLQGSITAQGSQIQGSSQGPNGVYDYYTGLAYEFSIPQAPTFENICSYNHGSPLDCQNANVSTTLGQFFQSGGGTFILSATNVALSPNQQQQLETTLEQSQTAQLAVIEIVLLASVLVTSVGEVTQNSRARNARGADFWKLSSQM